MNETNPLLYWEKVFFIGGKAMQFGWIVKPRKIFYEICHYGMKLNALLCSMGDRAIIR